VAALNNVELITALISFNCQLGFVGLQLRILNGVVSLLTSRVENRALATYVSEQSGASATLQMTTATLEVLACIAFKQPISQAEIDLLFDADKRGLVVKLRDLKLVEEFAGADGLVGLSVLMGFEAASPLVDRALRLCLVLEGVPIDAWRSGGMATDSGVRCLCDGEQLAGEWEAEAGRGEFDGPFVGPTNAAGDFRFSCFH
jgi:Segregation and condensation complex subunit ScpB